MRLASGGFVGVDLDAARIDGFRQQRPDLKWVAGNLYERLDAPELARVGVLNLDEYGEVGNRTADADFPLIRGLVQRGLDAFGEFALFWNQDLDAVVRRRQDRGQALAPTRGDGLPSPAWLLAAPRVDIRHVAAQRKRRADRFRISSVHSAPSRFIAAQFADIAWRICGSFCGRLDYVPSLSMIPPVH